MSKLTCALLGRSAVAAAAFSDGASQNPDYDETYAAFSLASMSGETVAKVKASLEAVLELLHPAINKIAHDHAMAALSISGNYFVEPPLSRHEVTVLACSLYMAAQGDGTIDYNDVLLLTDRFAGRAMNTTMVYKTMASLCEKNLLVERGRELDPKTERLSKVFSITEQGRAAFELAILNAHHLEISRGAAAA